MKLETQLILGCFIMGVIVSYAWWTRIRIYIFQLDLLALIEDLDSNQEAERDSIERMLRAFIVMLIHDTSHLSLPWLLHYTRHPAELNLDEESMGLIRGLIPSIKASFAKSNRAVAIESILLRLISRVLLFLCCETVGGWIYILYQLISGKWKTTLNRLVRVLRFPPTEQTQPGLEYT